MNSIEEKNAAKPERKFESISDFFQNATEAQKREVFLSILARANEAQRKVIEQARGSCHD